MLVAMGLTDSLLSIGGALRGEELSEVQLPTDALQQAAQARQEQLRDIIGRQRGFRESEVQRSLQQQARRGAEDIERRGRSQVAGARGGGQLLAARRAQAGTARQQTRLAGEVAEAAARTRAQEEEAEFRRLAAIEQAAARDVLLREQLRSRGFAGTLGTGLGAVAGGVIGGAPGAQVGGGLGGAAFGQAEARGLS
jgi:hypothetical protein